ncbi:hypothetical protein [Salmonella phage GSP193]|uniref:Uncharacterized protein n=1 Tax=Salmonella phage GSP193 TaxID=2962601 RepID=A0AAX3C1J9_9CAUD|nr:hypothetical protein [Salmonella phage GSP193]
MKVILARDKKTRKIIRSAVSIGRNEVIPFTANDVIIYRKKLAFSYCLHGFISQPLEDFKSRCGKGIIIQEAIING